MLVLSRKNNESIVIGDGMSDRPVARLMCVGELLHLGSLLHDDVVDDVLTRVTAIGHDLALDEGVGTCGKDGQGVPVSQGMPTIKVANLSVGGR